MSYPSRVLVALVALTAAVHASTRYTLLGRNTVEVWQSQVTCKNGRSAAVTTRISGELNALSDTRTNFSGDRWRRRMAELDAERDDERGHVVASVFGGPVDDWNLVPQHKSVNRKLTAQSSLLNRWDEFEKWARDQLGKRNGAPVRFTITVKYGSRNGCRPTGFEIDATSRASPGFHGSFDNGPYGSFAVTAKPSRPKKKP